MRVHHSVLVLGVAALAFSASPYGDGTNTNVKVNGLGDSKLSTFAEYLNSTGKVNFTSATTDETIFVTSTRFSTITSSPGDNVGAGATPVNNSSFIALPTPTVTPICTGVDVPACQLGPVNANLSSDDGYDSTTTITSWDTVFETAESSHSVFVNSTGSVFASASVSSTLSASVSDFVSILTPVVPATSVQNGAGCTATVMSTVTETATVTSVSYVTVGCSAIAASSTVNKSVSSASITTSTDDGNFYFGVSSGYTTWLNGKTPPSTESFVASTQTQLIVPVASSSGMSSVIVLTYGSQVFSASIPSSTVSSSSTPMSFSVSQSSSIPHSSSIPQPSPEIDSTVIITDATGTKTVFVTRVPQSSVVTSLPSVGSQDVNATVHITSTVTNQLTHTSVVHRNSTASSLNATAVLSSVLSSDVDTTIVVTATSTRTSTLPPYPFGNSSISVAGNTGLASISSSDIDSTIVVTATSIVTSTMSLKSTGIPSALAPSMVPGVNITSAFGNNTVISTIPVSSAVTTLLTTVTSLKTVSESRSEIVSASVLPTAAFGNSSSSASVATPCTEGTNIVATPASTSNAADGKGTASLASVGVNATVAATGPKFTGPIALPAESPVSSAHTALSSVTPKFALTVIPPYDGPLAGNPHAGVIRANETGVVTFEVGSELTADSTVSGLHRRTVSPVDKSSALSKVTTFITTTVSQSKPASTVACGGGDQQFGSAINWDDAPVWVPGNANVQGLAPPAPQPFHHLFSSKGFGYVSPPSDSEPYNPSSSPNLAVFNHTLSSNATHFADPFNNALRPGEIGAGARASSNAFWFNISSVDLGCIGSPCSVEIKAMKYNVAQMVEVATFALVVGMPSCTMAHNCSLSHVTLPAREFTGISGIQFIAHNVAVNDTNWNALALVPMTSFVIDNLQVGWANTSCAAGLYRASHH